MCVRSTQQFASRKELRLQAVGTGSLSEHLFDRMPMELSKLTRSISAINRSPTPINGSTGEQYEGQNRCVEPSWPHWTRRRGCQAGRGRCEQLV